MTFADGFIERRGRFKAQCSGALNTHFCPLISLLFYFCIFHFSCLLTAVVSLSLYSSVQYFISYVSLCVNKNENMYICVYIISLDASFILQNAAWGLQTTEMANASHSYWRGMCVWGCIRLLKIQNPIFLIPVAYCRLTSFIKNPQLSHTITTHSPLEPKWTVCYTQEHCVRVFACEKGVIFSFLSDVWCVCLVLLVAAGVK